MIFGFSKRCVNFGVVGKGGGKYGVLMVLVWFKVIYLSLKGLCLYFFRCSWVVGGNYFVRFGICSVN